MTSAIDAIATIIGSIASGYTIYKGQIPSRSGTTYAVMPINGNGRDDDITSTKIRPSYDVVIRGEYIESIESLAWTMYNALHLKIHTVVGDLEVESIEAYPPIYRRFKSEPRYQFTVQIDTVMEAT